MAILILYVFFDSDYEATKFVEDIKNANNCIDDDLMITVCKEISFDEFAKVTNEKYDELWRYDFYGDLSPLMFDIETNNYYDKIIKQERLDISPVFHFANNGFVQ